MGKQLKFLFLATLTTLMVLAGTVLQMGEPVIAAPSMHSIAIANQLYTRYPDIPRAQKANTTLLSRFIDYHLDTKARPGQYHLDWELSMADYLDAAYGDGTQAQGMAETDKRAMQALERDQRNQLVSKLEATFAQ
ncbi:hypothetical protein [Leptothoe kymatousa]|uniref:Uncharacterized protein n=1 Tax=Leptothoe kymatousa TAU-MAC 1615 TaxID=2364775 RepID=A0ABS5Y434_9CYAN|nr:hypothetical protein [Leptothoe kymatousa]MBT9312268.1 hypothetical protein [Leptothoe kymatousa TAU-MAC 1615]